MPASSSILEYDPMAQVFEDIFSVVGHSPQEISEMSTNIRKQILSLTFADLISKSPQDVQDEIISSSQKELNKDKVIKLFQNRFDSQEVMDSYQAATFTIMREYFSEVSPNLSDDQKKRIANIIQKQFSDLSRK